MLGVNSHENSNVATVNFDIIEGEQQHYHPTHCWPPHPYRLLFDVKLAI